MLACYLGLAGRGRLREFNTTEDQMSEAELETDLHTLIATCAFGLEAIVRRELEQLGYQGKVVGPGQIEFLGDERAICRANLWLRTADRVLLRMASFEATDFDALFFGTRDLDWARWIPANGAFPVIGRSLDSQLSSVPACQRAVKKAVVESLLASHSVETLDEDGGLFRIEIALHKNQARLTIDTTGPSLHKRGYRLQSTGAPLKETLAAALVLLSFWNRERPLIDPFCGSGTIPIEAALIGQNVAPGSMREFPSQDWPIIPATDWEEAKTESLDLIKPGLDERIIGGDIDSRALWFARNNAERAGVEELIHFQQQAFEDLSSKRKYGCVITNPPYGARLGEQHELEPLYAEIPRVLRGLPTWSHFILTAYPRFEALVQKKANRRRKLYNGRIECTYFQFHGPKAARATAPVADAPSPQAIAPDVEVPASNSTSTANVSASESDSKQTRKSFSPKPVFGGLSEKAYEQAELFKSRLLKRARHLRRWPTRQGITCYRLYERDIPEIPLIVDRYDDHLHITEYERPHDRDLAEHVDWLDLMARTAAEALEVERKKVMLKSRLRQRGSTQHDKLADERNEIVVHEGGLKFVVNLTDYVDTGLFLDHRITRSMVRDRSAGVKFLNLFGYTGSFTVYAASGGAAATTTVDWNRGYLRWAERNMQLNEFVGPQHDFIRSDARTFLRQQRESNIYDLAVVDPPTFSNSKRAEIDWQVQDDHVEMLNQVLALMKPAGVVLFSTNFRRFKLDAPAIRAEEIREISSQTVPDDFRNQRIHRCWRLVR